MKKERLVNNISTCELGEISPIYDTSYLNYLMLISKACDDGKLFCKKKYTPSLKELLYTNFIGIFDMKYSNNTVTLHYTNPVVYLIEHENTSIEVTLSDIITNIFLDVKSNHPKNTEVFSSVNMKYCSYLDNNNFQRIVLSKIKPMSVTGSKSSFLWNMSFGDFNNKKIYFSDL
jgi:hypothetical protein